MNEELRELFSEELEKNNVKINERFDKIDEKLEGIQSGVNVNKTNIIVGFKEAKEDRIRIERKLNDLYNAVDGFTKIVTKLETEFTMLKEDLNRVKAVLKEKLGVEI